MSSLVEQRESHYVEFLGEMKNQVWHSTDVKTVHVDVYDFLPTEDRKHHVLITGGMSDLRQNIPSRYEGLSPRAEILAYTHEPQNWMISVLKGLAEMPSNDDTFLHWGHTVPNGKPMTAIPSLLTSYFFVPPFLEAEGFGSMFVEEDAVDFLVMVPITEAERAFIKEKGSEAFLDILDAHNFDYIINEKRASFV